MFRVLRAEIMKAQWKLLASLVVAGPILSTLLGHGGDLPKAASKWEFFFTAATVLFAWLPYPLLAGVFAALLCRTEHANGGWKQTLVMPVSRTSVYLAKFALLAGLLLAANATFVALYVAEGSLLHFPGAVPWTMLGRALFSGWIAVLPLAALQLAVSTRWRSFGGGLALNVCLTLPAIFAAQSEQFGPWYPWAQPVLAMLPKVKGAAGSLFNASPTTLWVVIVGGFVLAMAGGLLSFVRADVRV